MATKKDKAESKVVIRLSGEILEKAMDLKATREKKDGKPISLASVIRDTVRMTWLAKEISIAEKMEEHTEKVANPRKRLEEILHPLGLNVDKIISTYGKIVEENKKYIYVRVAGDAFTALMSMNARKARKEKTKVHMQSLVREAILAKEKEEIKKEGAQK